ncbi:MAG: NAD-dependent epimerase/dehydratase family protein [Myxococcales bacterium]|nr:NAD-dependent epimerase/dehydratase family protein [Myxococcales bacterium]
MLVAVTGASGHVGGNLVRALLSRGRKVRAIVHSDTRAVDGLDLAVVRADVLDPSCIERALEGADVVYHLAAKIWVSGNLGGMIDRINREGTCNVVAACLKHKVRRLVHFSSIHAFRQEPRDEVLDEARECVAPGEGLPYDCSKVAGEAEVMAGVRQGLDAVIVNPTSVIGPLDFKPSPIGEAILGLLRGKFPMLVDGGFDWVDVRDVVAGAMAAEEKGRRGERYLLPGRWAPFAELARWVAEFGGVKVPQHAAPLWLAGVGAPFVTAWCRLRKRRPIYTLESLDVLRHSNRRISGKKAERELGYSARPLSETIRDTVAWFREQEGK